MNIIFLNKCKYTVCLNVDENKTINIKPNDKVNVRLNNKDKISVLIRQNNKSYKKGNKYNLVIETQYELKNIIANEIFKIKCEKTQIDINVYYERLFLKTEKAICCKEVNNINDKEEIMRIYKKSRIKYFLFISPIENMTGLTILSFLIGIFMIYKYGWILGFISFIIAYTCVLIVDQIAEKMGRIIFKKAFNWEDEEAEFKKYLKSEFINDYYLNPDTTPLMGKVENH